MRYRTVPSLMGVIATTALFAQALAPAKFEVESVKPNLADDRIVSIKVGPGGNFTARGYTLVLLMQRAYGVMGWNVSGGPGWIRKDRYDVAATANVEGDLTEAQLQPMLQALLYDQFKLRLHGGSKEMPGYALVVSKGGPKVQAAADGREHPDSFRMNATGISGQGIKMGDFARYVGGKLGLVAVDNTGLKGVYDFKVDWNAVDREALRSTVFAALEDQLGLKLNPQKITIQQLVIDSVDKVSEPAP